MTLTAEEIKAMDADKIADCFAKQNEELQHLKEQVELLTEALVAEKNNRFGRATEKNLTDAEENGQISFNEAEATADVSAAEPDVEQMVAGYKRKKHAGKREEDLRNLEHVEPVEHTIPEEDLRKEFPEGWDERTTETYEVLIYEPARYCVQEHIVHVYEGKDGRFLRAPHPKRLLRASVVTPSLAAAVINCKYTNGLPLYRMEQELQRRDISISRQTMANWVIRLSQEYLSYICARMWQHLKQCPVIQADETTVKVTKDGRDTGSTSYMWACRTGIAYPEKTAVLFDYQKTRSAEHPEEKLGGYRGILVTDGYEAYHKLDKENENIRVAGCWAHARRRFAEAVKAAGKNAKNTLAEAALKKIQKIYNADAKLADLPLEKRLEQRKIKVAPLVDDYFAWVKKNIGRVLPNSKTGKGFSYALDEEKYLRVFLERGDVPLDNNATERAIRPFTIGRKNWVMIDTVNGAEASAVMYSIVESAKANNLKIYEYVSYLLTQLPELLTDEMKLNGDLEALDDLMPWSEKIPDSCRKKTK